MTTRCNVPTPLNAWHRFLALGLLALPFLLSVIAAAEDTCQSVYVDHALVHGIHPERRRHRVPLILIPGRNLSSYIFLATPDGPTGWAQAFAASGFDVIVVNDPNFDFSKGFDVDPFYVPVEGAPPADSMAERAWQGNVWRRWGFGDMEDEPYPDTRFPVEYFADFEANFPYVSAAGRSHSQAVLGVLEAVGPGILVAHSAGAATAVTAAAERPDLVVGFVLVESAGPPAERDFPALAGMSMLGVYGDYIDSRRQGGRKEATEAAAALFREYGGMGQLISLPDDMGIYGNTHLMMQDDNSTFIAEMIASWLSDNMDTQPIPRRGGRRRR